MFLADSMTWGRMIWWMNARLTCALLTGADRIGQHAFCSKLCKTAIIISRTVFWCLSATDGRRAVQHTQITLKCELQFCVSHNSHVRRRSSCLICTLHTQQTPCSNWRGRGWPAWQDVGWRWRHVQSTEVWIVTFLSFTKALSKLFDCPVFPSLHP